MLSPWDLGLWVLWWGQAFLPVGPGAYTQLLWRWCSERSGGNCLSVCAWIHIYLFLKPWCDSVPRGAFSEGHVYTGHSFWSIMGLGLVQSLALFKDFFNVYVCVNACMYICAPRMCLALQLTGKDKELSPPNAAAWKLSQSPLQNTKGF